MSETTWPVRADRRRAREDLTRGRFDLLVIGGGIIGISTAWTAAQAGMRVALIDAGDFAGATSSASTKLVHGGLRYLQTGSVRLVAENHHERRLLAAEIAPHLVSPRRFLVPIYSDGPHGAAKLGAGVFVYSALSVFRDGIGRVITPARATELVPPLRTSGLRGAAVYTDHQMNDSRLAIMTVRAAVTAGATVLNHARVEALHTSAGRVCGADIRDENDGIHFAIAADRVVNATGPWVDHMRRMENRAAEPTVQFSKGVHVVARCNTQWKAGLTIPVDRSRVSFAIPWEDHVLLGTTDEYFDGDPALVAATKKDVDQILSEVGTAVTVSPADVTYAFAGLRVLPRTDADSSHAPRETVVTEGTGGMISVAGGKWTSYLRIGRQIVDRLGVRIPTLPPPALPGFGAQSAITQRLVAEHMSIPVAHHLATHYGTLAFDLLDLIKDDPRLGEQIHPGGPDIWAQVVFGRDSEWATTVDDIVRRRTTLAMRGHDSEQIRADIHDLLTPHV
jgi:glycerol-3-phosphate dehydrogenase